MGFALSVIIIVVVPYDRFLENLPHSWMSRLKRVHLPHVPVVQINPAAVVYLALGHAHGFLALAEYTLKD